MMYFLGGGGGGGAGGAAGCGWGAAAAGGVASAICPVFDCCISLASEEEAFLECFFSRVGCGVSAGGGACVSAGADGVWAAVTAGPTCKLFTTSLTPGTEAAWRLAASR